MAFEIPEGWPEFGTLDGERVALKTVDKLPIEQRSEVVVDVPGIGKIRPFRFGGTGEDIEENEDGELVI